MKNDEKQKCMFSGGGPSPRRRRRVAVATAPSPFLMIAPTGLRTLMAARVCYDDSESAILIKIGGILTIVFVI